MLAAKAVSQFKKDGYFVIPGVIDAVLNRRLGAFVGGIMSGAGSRRLLDEAWCAHLAGALRGDARIRSLLPRDAVAVQCTLFDKLPTKNWLVALHQDLSIPVRDRVDGAECSGWSEKEGQLYVQPPVSVLERLVAVRVHIDDCPAESGALRVVSGSHSEGRLSRERAEELRRENGETEVPVSRGGALVMRPLILHASSKATSFASEAGAAFCVWAADFAVGAGVAVDGLMASAWLGTCIGNPFTELLESRLPALGVEIWRTSREHGKTRRQYHSRHSSVPICRGGALPEHPLKHSASMVFGSGTWRGQARV